MISEDRTTDSSDGESACLAIRGTLFFNELFAGVTNSLQIAFYHRLRQANAVTTSTLQS
jgi:hypothetical protein